MLKTYGADERGNMAALAAVVMTVAIGLIGTSIDYRVTANAKARSQQISDAVALQAAVFVRNNNRLPNANDTNAIMPGDHTAADLGYEYNSAVKGGASGVTVSVNYDQNADEVSVTVFGETDTGFTKVLGKDSLGFKSETVVGMEKTDYSDVGSILLVLDNSGSMAWDDKTMSKIDGVWTDPEDAEARLSGLNRSVKQFMAYLDTLLDDEEQNEIIRTGMMAYNSETIAARTRSMQWNLIPNSHIDTMVAGGGTNSSIPISTAKTWMAGEDAQHMAVNGKTPLKFVVLMTDGLNNNNDSEWRQKTGTGRWRTKRDRRREWETNWTSLGGYQYRNRKNKPSDTWSRRKTAWWGKYTEYYRVSADSGWEEGEWSRPDDEQTVADCNQMKADGVKIYTIGFALEPGKYGENKFNSNGTEKYRTISESDTATAYSLLLNCATDNSTFLIAEDAEALTEAFATIGEDILEEFVRIKS